MIKELICMMLIVSTCVVESTEGEDLDADAQVISDFLVKIIEKYDVSGKSIVIQVLEQFPLRSILRFCQMSF